MEGNKYQNVFVDVIELKNKLNSFSNSTEDTSKLLFVIAALKIDEQEIPTVDYLQKFGYNLKRKVDFSEFFIIAQKILQANFKEVTILNDKYDPRKEGLFSLKQFCEDIDYYRNGVKNSESQVKQLNEFEILKKKIQKMNPKIIEDFTIYLCQQSQKLTQTFNQEEIKNLFDKVLNGKLSQEELNLIWNFIDQNKNSTIEIYELVDYIVLNFGKVADIFLIYVKFIGAYLDIQNITTRNFFGNYNIYDDSLLNKFVFQKKIQLILGIIENHAEIIFNQISDKTDNIHFSKFINEIEKYRKIKSEIIPQKKISSLEILSKESLEEIDNNKKQTDNIQRKESIHQEKNNDDLKETFGLLQNKLKELIEKNQDEFQILNKIILENEAQNLSILSLKKILRQFFDKKEIYILINYFKQCDLNKNGFIDQGEWKKFSKNLGVKQKVKKQKINLIKVDTNEEFYNILYQISQQEQLQIKKEFMNEISELENTQVSIITIKRYLKKIFPPEDITQFVALLSYFNQEKNGFINFNDMKFLMVLIESLEKEVQPNGDILRKIGLSKDKFFKNQLEKNSIDIFILLRHLVKWLDDSGEQIFGCFLHKIYKERKTFVISYKEFLSAFCLSENIQKFEYILDDHKNVLQSLNQWRNIYRKHLETSNPLQESFQTLSKNDQDIIEKEINFSNLPNKNEFLDFLLFQDWSDAEKQEKENFNILRVQIQNQLQPKMVQQQSSLREDRFDLQEIGTQKLMNSISNKNYEKVKQIIQTYFDNQTHLNFIKIKELLLKLCKKMKEDEMLKIFQHIDQDNTHSICKEEFLKYLELNWKDFKQSCFYSTVKASNSLQEIGALLQKKIKISKEQKQLINQFENYEIKPEHYLKGNHSIFTDLFAALKTAENFCQECAQNQKKFEDKDFGPNEEDEFGAQDLYFEGNPPPGYTQPDNIIWLRPEQISQNKPAVFLDEGASANDVIQGQIGDCWLISALSIIASNDQLLYCEVKQDELNKEMNDELANKLTQGVYPKVFHHLAQYGLYIMKFFKNCQWIYVLIDDRIPCLAGSVENPQIIFGQCHKKNEFWVPLIEKAQAKIHGNYGALIGGQLDDALVDMTGRVSEKLKIINNKQQFDIAQFKSPNEFFQRLNNEIKNQSMLGCSITQGKNTRGEGKVYIEDQFVGLMSGHAYGLMDLIDIGNEKLVRIRNPWGSNNPVEWNGSFSDNSPELIQNLQIINQKIKEKWNQETEEIQQENKDGAFLMSWSDFLKIWHNISICKKFSNEYEGIRFMGNWNENNAGGTPTSSNPAVMEAYVTNPQYILNLKQKTHLYINLGQEDGRMISKGNDRFPFENSSMFLSICIFELDQQESKLVCFDSNKLKTPPFLKINRDIQISIELPKGKYVIVPSTKGQQQFCDFYLSIYYNCSAKEIEIYDARTKVNGLPIQEESEEIQKFDTTFKSLLRDIILNKK